MTPLSDSRVLTMLLVLCVGTFVATSSGSALAPFLQFVAHDLDSDLPHVAHFFGFQAVTWGTSSVLAGLWAERIGRKRILVLGLLSLGLSRVGFSLAQSYSVALFWQLASGLAGGAFMGTVFATVSDHVAPAKRGRALSWIITGQSLSLLVGVPLITLLGNWGGWRGALGTHGVVTVFCTVFVAWVVPRSVAPAADARRRKVPLRHLLQPRLLSFLVAGTTERMCFAVVAMYVPVYLQRTYGVALSELAAALAVIALGTFVGNLVGGRIADATRARASVFAWSSLATALLAVPTFAWHPGLYVSIMLGFLYSLVNALGRPSLLATLSEVPTELRGAVFGIQIATASTGWLLAASVGAMVIATADLSALGWFAGALALVGAALAWASVRLPAQRGHP